MEVVNPSAVPVSTAARPKMRAMVQRKYGGPEVLHLAEVDRPAVAENGVLVRVRATAVHAGDWHLMRGEPFFVRFLYGGLRKPKIQILGCDAAGEVVAVGSAVTQFNVGDAVFGDLSEAGFGTFAEYVAAPETAFAPKPENLSFREAATIPVSALAALQGLRDVGQLQAGQRVLINGATGGVGMYAVQMAKALGAEVTAICGGNKVEFARALGADRAIDRAEAATLLKAETYDLMFDAAAYKSAFNYLPFLKPGGTYVLVGGETSRFFQLMAFAPLMSKISGRRVTYLTAKPNPEDLLVLKAWAEAGKFKPFIDRTYSLAEIPKAIAAIENREVRGKIAIAIDD